LSKLGGPPGWLLAAAIAAGTTTAMGYAAAAWFERGERISRRSMARISRAITESLVEQLKSLGTRRPARDSLRDRVREALEAIREPRSEQEMKTPSEGS
jgi:hypothetical protein